MLGATVMASLSDGPVLGPAVMDSCSSVALILLPTSSLDEINFTYTIGRPYIAVSGVLANLMYVR
jgi:hypothetical protein